MKSLHVRDIPEQTLERLKRRARRHHRSLQGELRAVLEAAAKQPLASDDGDGGFGLLTVAVGGEGWTREEIYGDDAR